MSAPSATDLADRPVRYISHALVEIRRYRWLPFGVRSGILLDMSTAGFKVELTSPNATPKASDRFWMSVPLAPLGLRGLQDLVCQVEVKWVDPKACRIGGVFVALDQLSQVKVEQIVTRLREQGNRI